MKDRKLQVPLTLSIVSLFAAFSGVLYALTLGPVLISERMTIPVSSTINVLVLMLGGPFSPLALFLKVIAVPGAILVTVWWLTHKSKDPRLGLATIIPAIAVYAGAVANNVIVAAKKVKKTVARER